MLPSMEHDARSEIAVAGSMYCALRSGRQASKAGSSTIEGFCFSSSSIRTTDAVPQAAEEVDDPTDRDDGPDELNHVDVEAGELSECDAMQDNLVPADPESNHQRETKNELERGPKHRHEPDKMQAPTNVFAISLFEGGDLRLLLREGTDEARTREVLLSLGWRCRRT